MTNATEQWASDLIRLGVPFKTRGRDRSGLDCWGLVVLHHREVLNITLPGYTELYDRADALGFRQLKTIFDREVPLCDNIPLGKEEPGDIAVLRMDGRPIHVGLVIGKRKMLHIEEGIYACAEPYTGIQWRGRLEGFYRHYASTGK